MNLMLRMKSMISLTTGVRTKKEWVEDCFETAETLLAAASLCAGMELKAQATSLAEEAKKWRQAGVALVE